jgi:hypothetical protein
MPEWLQDSFPSSDDIAMSLLVLRLTLALVLGCAVAGVYRLTYGQPRGQSAGLVPTLVLLTVLICLVTLVIGNSVARAFSLVGALAIVRFRTVVEDTRDTAFVIFAVAVGMAVGAGFLKVVLVGLPVAAVAALLFRQREPSAPASPNERQLMVRLGIGYDPAVVLKEVFGKHLQEWRLVMTATSRQGAALDLSYLVCVRPEGDIALVAELNRLEGVQSVELRQG